MREGEYQIALDAKVGERLEQIAAARGVSARELVTAMIGDTPVVAIDDAVVLSELESLWSAVEAGTEPVIHHDDVRKWLLTWGTDDFSSMNRTSDAEWD